MYAYVALAWLASLAVVAFVTERYTAQNVHNAEKALRVDAIAQARVDQVETEKKLDQAKTDADRAARTLGGQLETERAKRLDAERRLANQVPIYVTAEADARCTVPNGFVWLYDRAFGGTLADPAAGAPATGPESADGPSGVPLSQVSAADVANAAIAREWEAQARGLRAHLALVEAFYERLKENVRVCK